MAKVITTEDLKKKMDAGEKFFLLDTLSANSFEGRHIPGAHSVPYGPDFMKKFGELGASKEDEVITYCASAGCQLSVLAADELEKAGYTNVGHYKDGLAGWQNAGYEFDPKS